MNSQSSSRGVSSSFATAVVLLVSFFVPVLLRAQVAGATLSGTVTDPSNAAVPNANVSIKNIETGISREITSNDAGFYNAPNLSPGAYEVSASAAGFSKLVQTNVTLTVGAQQVLNLSLQVGEVSQTVQVASEAPSVELTSSTVTGLSLTMPRVKKLMAMRWSMWVETSPPPGILCMPSTVKLLSLSKARIPFAVSPAMMAARRSLSFTRSSSSPIMKVLPLATAAAMERMGYSSIMEGARAAGTATPFNCE